VKKFITSLIIFTMLISTTAFADITITTYNPENRLTFSDVPSTHWAYKDVMTITSKGILKGKTEPVNGVGTYNPDDNVTVGEFLAIATRLVAKEKILNLGGETSHWAYPYYFAAMGSGLIEPKQFEGVAEELDAPMLREDMAMVLVKIAVMNGERLEIAPHIENAIYDYETIDASKRESVKKAYSNALLTGKDTTGRFDPKGNLTRAEVATVFCRVMNYTERPEVKFSAYDDVQILTGENAGLMRLDVAKKYDLQALKSARFYKENGKFYVSIDLPELPYDFKWDFGVSAFTEDDEYVFATYDGDWKDKTGKQVIEVYSQYDDKTIADMAYATLAVRIVRNDNRSIVIHELVTKSPNKVLRQSSLNTTNSAWEDFDTSNIFGW